MECSLCGVWGVWGAKILSTVIKKMYFSIHFSPIKAAPRLTYTIFRANTEMTLTRKSSYQLPMLKCGVVRKEDDSENDQRVKFKEECN
ncbi:hypothetical protein D5R40_10595 [Okeania hirsuta]|uniref:Uncharacterized protein n=1 Tax=Okeania hirsuta TaxID=1458930 RepID=A0A3N6PWU9_9CYAN|nr:hypothetical protein D4Z78_04145 [Okeania hirsuta]RQH45433.1 hypothetical protein D5R40_10595 [Okeania hirsuta]